MRSSSEVTERSSESGENGGSPPRFGGEAAAGGIMLLFALAYLLTAFFIPESSFGDVAVGPKAVPVAISIAMSMASVALLVRGLRATVEPPSEDDAPPQDLRKLAVVALLLLGYILVFVPLGYAISTTLFMMGATTYLDREHLLRNAIYAVVFSAVVYSIFVFVFGVQLPAGILG